MSSHCIVVETPLILSGRARQLSAIFDVPLCEKSRLEWQVDIDLNKKWNVGLITGPSGSGKSTIAKRIFETEYHKIFSWEGASVIDDFSAAFCMQDISAVCQAVGFNTIPAWLRPYNVLSTGERFRVDLARRLLELADPIVVDEFSSVVDRQVAQIGSHAVQKYIRKNDKKFVAVSCHRDIIDWLQPDWVYDVPLATQDWRSLRQRPQIDVEIRRVPHKAWSMFAPFHYLTRELHKNARCFVLFANSVPAAFAGVLHFPHPIVKDIKSLSRLVTLPDWQGLGLAFVLTDFLAACYKTMGFRLRTYPAHPSLIRAFDNSNKWALKQRPGMIKKRSAIVLFKSFGARPCAVFEYKGLSESKSIAEKMIAG